MQTENGQLYLFTEINPKPEHFEDCRAAIEKIKPITLSKDGCQLFSLMVGLEPEKRLFLFTIWSDENALTDHHNQPYTQEIFELYQSWLAEPVKNTKMRSGSALTKDQF